MDDGDIDVDDSNNGDNVDQDNRTSDAGNSTDANDPAYHNDGDNNTCNGSDE